MTKKYMLLSLLLSASICTKAADSQKVEFPTEFQFGDRTVTVEYTGTREAATVPYEAQDLAALPEKASYNVVLTSSESKGGRTIFQNDLCGTDWKSRIPKIITKTPYLKHHEGCGHIECDISIIRSNK